MYLLFSFQYLRIKGETVYAKLNQRKRRPPPPFGLKVYKGFKNVILRRDFVEFLVMHPVANALKTFLKNTLIPDEHFYATMSRIEHIEMDNET